VAGVWLVVLRRRVPRVARHGVCFCGNGGYRICWLGGVAPKATRVQLVRCALVCTIACGHECLTRPDTVLRLGEKSVRTHSTYALDLCSPGFTIGYPQWESPLLDSLVSLKA